MPEPQTNTAKIAVLVDRGMLRVWGPDAAKLLQGLVTNDLDAFETAPAMFAALLTPQGKILFDFLVVKEASDSFRLETSRSQVPDLTKRLGFYKLRAKAEIADVSADYTVAAAWGAPDACAASVAFQDPRLAALGQRIHVSITSDWALGEADAAAAPADAYHAHRVALGVPEGGRDYAFGEAFPHEALLDQLAGLSMTKGCYIGQEVVSRMEHRGTARKRIVRVSADAPLPAPGTDIRAGDATIGALASTAGTIGLALVRLDRLAEADDKELAITAAGIPISVTLPDFARFTLRPAKSHGAAQ